MSMEYEQAKEIEAMIERRLAMFDRLSRVEQRITVIEHLDHMAKTHDAAIRRLWIWSLGSIFTALIALIVTVLQVFG